eukprot:SAG31_NODE_4488_length_3193_cov_5.386555_2_plen_168_part_00
MLQVLRRNILSGSLPAGLGLLTETVDMNLRENRFDGTLPIQLGQIRTLRHFSIFWNRISGTLPREILSGLPLLGTFRPVPNGGQGGFDLTINMMSGSIPSEISALHGFHGNLGLGGRHTPRCAQVGGGKHCNSWVCPVPPVTFSNSTMKIRSTNYSSCHRLNDHTEE